MPGRAFTPPDSAIKCTNLRLHYCPMPGRASTPPESAITCRKLRSHYSALCRDGRSSTGIGVPNETWVSCPSESDGHETKFHLDPPPTPITRLIGLTRLCLGSCECASGLIWGSDMPRAPPAAPAIGLALRDASAGRPLPILVPRHTAE